MISEKMLTQALNNAVIAARLKPGCSKLRAYLDFWYVKNATKAPMELMPGQLKQAGRATYNKSLELCCIPGNLRDAVHDCFIEELARDNWIRFPRFEFLGKGGESCGTSIRYAPYKVYLYLTSSVADETVIEALKNIIFDRKNYMGEANIVRSRLRVGAGQFELICHPGAYSLKMYKTFVENKLLKLIEARLNRDGLKVKLERPNLRLEEGVLAYFRQKLTKG